MSGGTEQAPADSAESTPAVGWEGWDPRGWRSPIYVATVDIAEPIADLKCVRSLEPSYTAAWILVLDSGYPMGCVEVPVDGDVVSAEKILHEIGRQIGSRTAAARPAPTAALPRISVVIPTNLARPDQMQRCAARLAELDYPDYEVIIVDNRRGGPAVEFPGARVVREPVPGISAARNRGIDAATGEIKGTYLNVTAGTICVTIGLGYRCAASRGRATRSNVSASQRARSARLPSRWIA